MPYLFSSLLSIVLAGFTALIVATIVIKMIVDLSKPVDLYYKVIKLMFQLAALLLFGGNFSLLTGALWLANHRYNAANGWYEGVSHELVNSFMRSVLAAEVIFAILWVLAHIMEYFRTSTDEEPPLDMTNSLLAGRP